MSVADEDIAVGSDQDDDGALNSSLADPATPGLPSVIKSLPSGLNLKT
jgi:hypothetical protein